jgi:predicted nucleic acid-binding protein
MQQAPDGRLFAALDTSVLINFLRLGRLDLLTDHSDWRFVVTDHVGSEVLETTQQNALSHALSQAQMDLILVSEQSELERFAQLNTFLGKGESAAIAVAENRDWLIAMDEGGKARRTVQEGPCKNRLITTPGILLDLIRKQSITVEDADDMKLQLEAMKFKMTFNSFADLL